MPKENFDYQSFATSLAQQAQAAIPAEVSPENKDLLAQIIYSFAIKAGEALVQEDNSLLTAAHVQMIVQYIAEWTFHKGLELLNSTIPKETWQMILQAIAGGIYECGKQSLTAGLDPDTISNIIQGEVQSHYINALNELKSQGAITDEHIMSIQEAQMKAQEQIVISQETSQPAPVDIQQLPQKEAKLATVAVLLSSLPEEKALSILQSFTPEEAEKIKKFMQPENMNFQIDPNQTFKLLNNLKQTISPEEAPNQMAKKIQILATEMDPVKILLALKKERPYVQNYVKSCIEGKFIRRDFSPYLAKCIIKHLEKQLYGT